MFSQVLLFFFVAWAARTLLPQEFGKFSFSLTYALFFLIFIEWGTNVYTVREIGTGIKDPFFLIPFKISCAIIGYMFLFLSTYIPQIRPFKSYITILGIGMIGASFLQYSVAVFQGFGKLRYGSILLFIQKLLYIGTGILLIYFFKSAFSLTISYTIGMALASILGIVWIKKTFFIPYKKSIANFPSILKTLIPFVFVRFFSEIYFRVDILMIQFFLGSYMVGLYALPYKIIEALMLFVNSFVFSLFPELSHDAVKNMGRFKKSLGNSFRIIVFWGFFLVVSGFLSARWALFFFFGKAYRDSLPVIYILFIALFFMQINFLLTHALLSLKKERLYAILIMITAIFNFLLNLWFIPYYKIIGAAITTLASEMLLFLFTTYEVYKWIKNSNG